MIEPLRPFSADMKTPTPGEQRRIEARRKQRAEQKKQRQIEKAHQRLLETIFAEELAEKRRNWKGGA